MSAYPYNFFIGIIIKRFYIIMRNAVAPFLWAIPFEFACAAVVIIQSAAFGSYPQITVFILNGASYNRITQPFLLVGRVGITGVDFIFRIEVVDTAEIGSQPKCTLVIFYDTPDGRVGEPVGLCVIGCMVLE